MILYPKIEKKRAGYLAIYLSILLIAVSVALTGCSGSSSSTQDTSSDNQPVQEAKDYKLDAGMYKVGTDIAAGEYMLVADGDAYYEIDKDSSGDMNSVITNDNFGVNRYIKLVDGEYIKLVNCKLYDLDKVPNLPEKEMYKVGVDLKAGEYKVHSDADGYYEVTNDPGSGLTGIITNNNFSGDAYITVKDGQYLKLVNAKLINQ